MQRGLEGSVDGRSKALCRLDHRDCGTITETHSSDRWFVDGIVAALAWIKWEVPRSWPVPRRAKTQRRNAGIRTMGDNFEVIDVEKILALQQIR